MLDGSTSRTHPRTAQTARARPDAGGYLGEHIHGLTVALVLAEILSVVQVFTPAHAVTVCYCCYCCSAVSKQKMPKNPGKTRKYQGFSGYFRVLPALDAGDRRGSLPGLPYCCSVGLTLATVVGEPHCCSVVTVNTSNTVQFPTLNSSTIDAHHLPRAPGTRPCRGCHRHARDRL